MKVMNLFLQERSIRRSQEDWTEAAGGLRAAAGNSPVQDAQRRVPLSDQTQTAVAAALVLERHAADQDHHVPQLLGRAPALLGTWQLLAGGGQELAELRGLHRCDPVET